MQLGDSSKKNHPDTPPEDFLHMFTFFEYTPNPEELTSSSLAIIFRFYQKSSRVVYYHQTYREKSPNHRFSGFPESTKVTWNRNQGVDWESHGFLEDFFLPNQNRGDWIGFVGKWKKEWKLLVTFFFCNVFFCFRFLIATGFCNCCFEPVLKIFSIPKTSFLL